MTRGGGRRYPGRAPGGGATDGAPVCGRADQDGAGVRCWKSRRTGNALHGPVATWRSQPHCMMPSWRGWIVWPRNRRAARGHDRRTLPMTCRPSHPWTPRPRGRLAQLVEAEVVAQRGLPRRPTRSSTRQSGRGLRVAAPEHPAAVSSAHCPGVGRALLRDCRDASPKC